MLTVRADDRLTSFSGFDFSKIDRVLLALSGGGDSTALLHLFHSHWTSTLGRSPSDVFAATVNHGVRNEAAREAENVASWCAGLGIGHRTLHWDGGSITSGFQSAARDARYEKLAACASDLGIGLVLTGHTADDQRETLVMRARRKADGNGMAGIAPATLFARRIWFARPLLDAPRAALRQFLCFHELPWSDDPSNFDTHYERVRVRRIGGQAADDALSHASQAAQQRKQAAKLAARWLGLGVRVETNRSGRLCADVEVTNLATEGAAIGFAYLLMLIGMQSHLPPAARVGRGINALQRNAASSFTVAGCLLERKGDRVRVAPETRNIRLNGFGLDHLLPIWDLPVLDALDRLRGLDEVNRPLFCRFG